MSFGSGNWDVYLIKTNSIGDTLWTKAFGGVNDEQVYYVRQISDNGYILTGWTNSFGAGGDDIYLIKTDAIGNLLWTKTFGKNFQENSYSVEQTSDNGHVIVGYSPDSTTSSNVYLIKTDSNGNLLWTKTFGGAIDDIGYSIQQTYDNCLIIAGRSNSFGSAGHVYLIKTDSVGNSGCNESNIATIVTTPPTIASNPSTLVSSGGIVTTPASLTSSGGTGTTLCMTTNIAPNHITSIMGRFIIYPNPTIEEIRLLTEESGLIEIYTVLGEMVLASSFDNHSVINCSALRQGIYFYIIKNKDFQNIGTGKLIIVDK